MPCCGTDLMSGTGVVALLAISTHHLKDRAIVIVIVRCSCRDCHQWSRDLLRSTHPRLHHQNTPQTWHALRLSGSWTWLESHTHTHTHTPCILSMTVGIDNRKSRRRVVALGAGTTQPCIYQLTLRSGHRYRPEVMITVTGSARWSLHAAGRYGRGMEFEQWTQHFNPEQ